MIRMLCLLNGFNQLFSWVEILLVRAECVRCPWLQAETKVATILGNFCQAQLQLAISIEIELSQLYYQCSRRPAIRPSAHPPIRRGPEKYPNCLIQINWLSNICMEDDPSCFVIGRRPHFKKMEDHLIFFKLEDDHFL